MLTMLIAKDTKREWTGMMLFFVVAIGFIVLSEYTENKKSAGESVVSIQRKSLGTNN